MNLCTATALLVCIGMHCDESTQNIQFTFKCNCQQVLAECRKWQVTERALLFCDILAVHNRAVKSGKLGFTPQIAQVFWLIFNRLQVCSYLQLNEQESFLFLARNLHLPNIKLDQNALKHKRDISITCFNPVEDPYSSGLWMTSSGDITQCELV